MIVLESALEISPLTWRPVAIDMPKSPETARPSQMRYCMGNGRSSPYAFLTMSMVSALASSGNRVVRGQRGSRLKYKVFQ
jgi:hypothetical protein